MLLGAASNAGKGDLTVTQAGPLEGAQVRAQMNSLGDELLRATVCRIHGALARWEAVVLVSEARRQLCKQIAVATAGQTPHTSS